LEDKVLALRIHNQEVEHAVSMLQEQVDKPTPSSVALTVCALPASTLALGGHSLGVTPIPASYPRKRKLEEDPGFINLVYCPNKRPINWSLGMWELA
jgi:hypothetical protein